MPLSGEPLVRTHGGIQTYTVDRRCKPRTSIETRCCCCGSGDCVSVKKRERERERNLISLLQEANYSVVVVAVVASIQQPSNYHARLLV